MSNQPLECLIVVSAIHLFLSDIQQLGRQVKNVFEHAQNVRIHIILRIRKVSSGTNQNEPAYLDLLSSFKSYGLF